MLPKSNFIKKKKIIINSEDIRKNWRLSSVYLLFDPIKDIKMFPYYPPPDDAKTTYNLFRG